MRFKELFQRNEETSASAAKERLKIILSHERTLRGQPEFLPRLQQDILDVVKRYVAVSNDQVRVQMQESDRLSILEINVTFPEKHLSS
ncbi:cell division topological specificity factor [Marinospirillum celere]|uniref:Cell division topological specificity factor n=1 Tax=Marinospirillum celere TaxID=1122252 RepID=A0A1I1JNH5_9GAMM|nr:cell division topological specificity factor MinE [Marinospirillum celere]SFC50036.1 cell division topological specificity factor [Marinospirillum celere]